MKISKNTTHLRANRTLKMECGRTQGQIAFTEGKVYTIARADGSEVDLRNDMGQPHSIGSGAWLEHFTPMRSDIQIFDPHVSDGSEDFNPSEHQIVQCIHPPVTMKNTAGNHLKAVEHLFSMQPTGAKWCMTRSIENNQYFEYAWCNVYPKDSKIDPVLDIEGRKVSRNLTPKLIVDWQAELDSCYVVSLGSESLAGELIEHHGVVDYMETFHEFALAVERHCSDQLSSSPITRYRAANGSGAMAPLVMDITNKFFQEFGHNDWATEDWNECMERHFSEMLK